MYIIIHTAMLMEYYFFFYKTMATFLPRRIFCRIANELVFQDNIFLHNDQLSSIKHRTWMSSSIIFQHWCEEEIPSNFALAKWALIFPVFGNMISGMLCIYYSKCTNSRMK